MNETQLSHVQVGKSTPWLAAGAMIAITGLLGFAIAKNYRLRFRYQGFECALEPATR